LLHYPDLFFKIFQKFTKFDPANEAFTFKSTLFILIGSMGLNQKLMANKVQILSDLTKQDDTVYEELKSTFNTLISFITGSKAKTQQDELEELIAMYNKIYGEESESSK
jgi:hypothetical protein